MKLEEEIAMIRRGAGNNGRASTDQASSFLNAAGRLGGWSPAQPGAQVVDGDARRVRLSVDRAASLGLPAEATARLLAPVRIPLTELHSQSQRTARTIIANAGVILTFMAIAVYGGYVLTGVVEEKSSRVVEVLLSRAPPSSLLGGKITGIGLAGLAQFLTVAAAAAATLLITRPSGLPLGTYTAIPALVLWFVLGFAFYSTLYGSLGSLGSPASRTEDAQAAAGPLIALHCGAELLQAHPRDQPRACRHRQRCPPGQRPVQQLRPAHSQVPQVIGSGLASLWLLCFTRAWERCRSG